MAIDWLTGMRSMFRSSGTAFDQARSNVALAANTEMTPAERYAVQRRYYSQNGLYLDLAKALYEQGVVNRSVRGILNPAFRIVEFYPDHLWPGDLPEALPIVTENERIIEPIQQVWKWSRWGRKKDVLARRMAMLGDAFIKVVRPVGGPRVWFQLIDPADVTFFDTDERDNVIEARIDVPIVRRNGRSQERFIHTEMWSKAEQTYRRWEHTNTSETPIEELGAPLEEIPFDTMGINFVPIVHIPFRDIGELRGAGAFIFQLDKIDQINAEATRLSQMLYRHNKQFLAVFGGKDASGRDLPAPRIGNSADGTSLEVKDETVLSFSGDGSVQSLVPNLNYEAHLKEIEMLGRDLEHDCPELAYYRINEFGGASISGRALNLILGPCIKRAMQTRGLGEDGMANAAEMALTIGSFGKSLFPDIGTFEHGDFEHEFEKRPVIPVSENEDAETNRAEGLAAQAWQAAGLPLEEILKRANYTDEQIVEIVNRRADELAGDTAVRGGVVAQ